MKKILLILLALSLALGLGACGGDSAAYEPNAGNYEAVSAEMRGITVDVNDVLGEGFSLELKAGSKAVFHYEGKSYQMKWSLDDETFHAEGGGATLDGTLQNGVMVLQNVLDSGVQITLICQELAEACGDEEIAQETDPAQTRMSPSELEEARESEETAREPEEELTELQEEAVDSSPLWGSWRHESGYTYIFREDGTGAYQRAGGEMTFTYQVQKDGGLSILFTGTTNPMETSYVIRGRDLIIKDSMDRDVVYTWYTDEPVLDALSRLPDITDPQAAAMSNWMGFGLGLIEDDVYYGRYFVREDSCPKTVAMKLINDGHSIKAGEWRYLEENALPHFMQSKGESLFYIKCDAVTEEQLGLVRVNKDGSEYRVLFEGICDFLNVVGERLYFTDPEYRLVSTDLEGKDLQVVLDREVYYTYFLDQDWFLFQDDADGESLHLYYLPSQVDIKLNDERSYHPILSGKHLFFTSPDRDTPGAFHLAHVDLNQREENYNEKLGYHVPSFTVEHSELLMGDSYYLADGDILLPNNAGGKALEYWMFAEDDAYKGYTRLCRYISEDYQIEDIIDENGYIEGIVFSDRHTNYGYGIPWLQS